MKTQVTLTIMIDIWGQSLSMSEPTAETSAGSIEDVKKIIEDEIAEMLNLVNVDPNELVVFQDKQGKLKSSNISVNDILIRQSDAAENSIALYSNGGQLKPGNLISTITDAIATNERELNDLIRGYNNFRKNVVHKFFGTPLVVGMTLAEIKDLLNSFFANKEAGRMMTASEIKANYLEIFKLKEDQKPTNDIVGRFFGNPLVAGMTLAEISEFIGKHTHNAYIANSFFGVPATSTMTLKDINMFMVRQTTLNTIVDRFLGRTPVSETTSLTGPTLAEIKSAIDEQKSASEIVNKFFGIPHNAGMSLVEIIAAINKIKIPHSVSVNNIVYTVDSGTFDWIRGNDNYLYVGHRHTSVPGCYRFTIIHRRKFDLEFSNWGITGVNTLTYILDKVPKPPPSIPIPFPITINNSDESVIRESLPWIIEFLYGVPSSDPKTRSIIG